MYFKLLLTSLAILSLSSAAYAQNALRLNAIQLQQAEDSTAQGGFLIKSDTNLENISSGDWFSLPPANLGAGADTITLRYAKADESDITLEIRQGGLTGPIVSNGVVPSTGGADEFTFLTFPVNGLSQSEELFYIFGGDGILSKIDAIYFGRSQRNIIQAEENFASAGAVQSGSFVRHLNSESWLHFKDVQNNHHEKNKP